MEQWNGKAFLCPPASLPTVELVSDASGSWGCGAWHGNSWFQVQWDRRADKISIAVKELLPIVLTCVMWGHAWRTHQVRCLCDNQVIVAALQSRSSRDPGVMHLLRCLVFAEAQLGCFLQGQYINTHANHLADDLSRNRVLSFLSKVPEAEKHPSPVAQQLLQLLLNPQADWVSPSWRQQFSAIFRKN